MLLRKRRLKAKSERKRDEGGKYGAEGGNRTRTSIAEHRILSPGRLPVPPLRQIKPFYETGFAIYSLKGIYPKRISLHFSGLLLNRCSVMFL
jgi:hypothetical protein